MVENVCDAKAPSNFFSVEIMASCLGMQLLYKWLQWFQRIYAMHQSTTSGSNKVEKFEYMWKLTKGTKINTDDIFSKLEN